MGVWGVAAAGPGPGAAPARTAPAHPAPRAPRAPSYPRPAHPTPAPRAPRARAPHAPRPAPHARAPRRKLPTIFLPDLRYSRPTRTHGRAILTQRRTGGAGPGPRPRTPRPARPTPAHPTPARPEGSCPQSSFLTCVTHAPQGRTAARSLRSVGPGEPGRVTGGAGPGGRGSQAGWAREPGRVGEGARRGWAGEPGAGGVAHTHTSTNWTPNSPSRMKAHTFAP